MSYADFLAAKQSIELKRSYYEQAVRNLQNAHKESGDLFAVAEVA